MAPQDAELPARGGRQNGYGRARQLVELAKPTVNCSFIVVRPLDDGQLGRAASDDVAAGGSERAWFTGLTGRQTSSHHCLH